MYFYCRHAPIESDPTALPRPARTTAPLRDALEQLLAGPSENETSAGFYHSIFSPGTEGMLDNVIIQADGTTVVDFTHEIAAVNNISTSGAGNQVVRSLASTIFQFRSVNAVTFRIAGDRQAWCDLLEIVCDQPSLTRAAFEAPEG